jgi:hypothetical protein
MRMQRVPNSYIGLQKLAREFHAMEIGFLEVKPLSPSQQNHLFGPRDNGIRYSELDIVNAPQTLFITFLSIQSRRPVYMELFFPLECAGIIFRRRSQNDLGNPLWNTCIK